MGGIVLVLNIQVYPFDLEIFMDLVLLMDAQVATVFRSASITTKNLPGSFLHDFSETCTDYF